MANNELSTEKIAHDLTLEAVRASIEGFQQGNSFQVSDVDIAKYAVNIYEECYPVIYDLIAKK
ncbi:hypothetical protein LJC56_07390 [Christensenellaceae bacterium OttesenSCG-928-K19]|nr:hypothetical protein [Christensenellaceae bacterium OttesenSCG-928-K19]